MNPRSTLALGRSALRSGRLLLGGDVRFPRDRLGYVLERPDGRAFRVYRETARRSTGADDADERVVLVFELRVTRSEAKQGLRDVLFAPFANVATPFFAGMPGFRRKLWLAGRDPGEYLELYEWDSAGDAERFVAVLRALLAPFEFAVEPTFEVVRDDSIDEYVVARAVEWRAPATRRPRRAARGRSVGVALLTLSVLAAFLLWRRGARAGGGGEEA
ncbi:MAG: hypothetical protein ABEJ04_02930 [Halobacteriaceae archaeon]